MAQRTTIRAQPPSQGRTCEVALDEYPSSCDSSLIVNVVTSKGPPANRALRHAGHGLVGCARIGGFEAHDDRLPKWITRSYAQQSKRCESRALRIHAESLAGPKMETLMIAKFP
jgi:hypothetical protein